MRQEEGFTLVELIVVMVIIAVLLSIAFVFHYGAQERSSDATARANIRTAVPAIEAYRSETGGYAGMTVAGLKTTYSAGHREHRRRVDDGRRLLRLEHAERSRVVEAGPGRHDHADGVLSA